MKFNDVAVDCETLGDRFDAPVIAIGMQAFDRESGAWGASYYGLVELDSAIKTGVVRGDTLKWWMQQSEEARDLFDKKHDGKRFSLATILVEVSHWCTGRGVGANMQNGPLHVWGNGATQDITWLEHAFTNGAHGLAIPWRYDRPRDMRTLVEAATLMADFTREEYDADFEGTPHNALDDARHQALIISKAWRALRDVTDQEI